MSPTGTRQRIHKSEGATIDDDAFLLGANLYREAAYTGGSRSKSATHYYLVAPKAPKHLTRHDMVDPIMNLAARLGVSRAQLLATDQLPPTGEEARPGRPIRELARDARRITATLTAEPPPPPGDTANRWAVEHHAEVQRWCQVQDAIVEQRNALGVAALYQPAAHLVDALGPAPTSGAGRQRWAETAGRIEAYRAAHDIDETAVDVLGPKPEEVVDLVEWRHARAAIDGYRHRHLDQGLHR